MVKGSEELIKGAAIFSLVTGSHTHYLAADTAEGAASWVRALRRAWVHCFKHTSRATHGVQSFAPSPGQQLAAENLRLRSSIAELQGQVANAAHELKGCAHGFWRRYRSML